MADDRSHFLPDNRPPGLATRNCATCRGTGFYALPEDLAAKCQCCGGSGFYYVFDEYSAARLVAQKDAEIARLTARVAELEAELRRVAPHLATHGVGGYRMERP